jgi:hypothetical protein
VRLPESAKRLRGSYLDGHDEKRVSHIFMLFPKSLA